MNQVAVFSEKTRWKYSSAYLSNPFKDKVQVNYILPKINWSNEQCGYLWKLWMIFLREGVKYYFADFVRKGGTPPPFTDKIFAKKRSQIWGGAPPPLRTFP